MIIETLLAFGVLVLGCVLATPKLRPIAWTTDMRETYVAYRTR